MGRETRDFRRSPRRKTMCTALCKRERIQRHSFIMKDTVVKCLFLNNALGYCSHLRQAMWREAKLVWKGESKPTTNVWSRSPRVIQGALPTDGNRCKPRPHKRISSKSILRASQLSQEIITGKPLFIKDLLCVCKGGREERSIQADLEHGS